MRTNIRNHRDCVLRIWEVDLDIPAKTEIGVRYGLSYLLGLESVKELLVNEHISLVERNPKRMG
jgi:hypothetical protein